MTHEHHPSVHAKLLQQIREGRVHMRPRWQFVARALLVVAGAALLATVLLYLASLVVFFLREDGSWFAPVFGVRGWFDMLRSLPLILILLVAACALALEAVVRTSSFGYRKPLVSTLGAILGLAVIGGIGVSMTPLHPAIERAGTHMPGMHGPVGFWYRGPLRPRPPGDTFRGEVIRSEPGVLIIKTQRGTTTLMLDEHTRLPRGAGFSPGDTIFAIGDDTASGTVRAFGIRKIDPRSGR